MKDFDDDFDTTGHIEIDATPPIAAKKIRKRTGSRKNSSSVDPDDSNMEVSAVFLSFSSFCENLTILCALILFIPA